MFGDALALPARLFGWVQHANYVSHKRINLKKFRDRFGDLFVHVGGLGTRLGLRCLQYPHGSLQNPLDVDCVKLIWVGMNWRSG